jgi:hypothetical protein
VRRLPVSGTWHRRAAWTHLRWQAVIADPQQWPARYREVQLRLLRSDEYFRNNGDGTFTEQAARMGLADQLGGLNIVQTDYNNDGCLDILVMRGGWESAQHRSLLRNKCNSTSTDVTKS